MPPSGLQGSSGGGPIGAGVGAAGGWVGAASAVVGTAVSAGTVVAATVAGALVGSMTAARVGVAGAAVGRRPQAARMTAANSSSLIGWVGFISMPFLVALNQS